MKETQIIHLVAAAVFSAAAAAIVVRGLYGQLQPISIAASAVVWVLAVVCVWAARRVKNSVDKNNIGLDRSQLSPLEVARWLVVGKASAWTGAVVAGAYAGLGTYIIPHSAMLMAAADDVPGTIITCIGGIALAIAGVVLERSCSTPPPHDTANAGA